MSYRIRRGDTLSAVSQRFGVSVRQLQTANPKIKNPNLIYAGETLTIPGRKDAFEAPKARRTKGASQRSGGSGGTTRASGTTNPAPRGQVGQWIQQAVDVLRRAGVPASKMNPNDIALIIQRESGGNPNAQNNWDSNARRGTPSIGLMQTIGPTFNAYKLPGHSNIRNPVDNIIAGVRYAISRYGSVSNVPGVRAVHGGRPYVGY